MSYIIYAYHKGLPEHRFDSGMTQWLEHLLRQKNDDKVSLVLTTGDNAVYENDGDVFKIPHGSLTIIENTITKQFHVSDFGDNCADVFPLTKFKNFGGMTLGQYNRYKVERDIPNERIRNLIHPGYYPETNWNFGAQVFEQIKEYRETVSLDKRLHFRGTVYPQLRDTVLILQKKYPSDVYIGNGRLSFDAYMQEVASFKMTLSMGMSPYSSDVCFRDIEMFGIGIPVIRPQLHVELADPLLPDIHYISCDVELDPYTLWTNNSLHAAHIIYEKYKSVVDNEEFLQYISSNAREWYLRNIAEPNPAINLIKWLTI